MEKNIPTTQTKVLVPRRRSDILSRQRLLDILYDLLDYKLIIVSAPPGYGKTSLIIDFAHHTEWPFCWYSLDSLDQDPQRFLTYFISSIALQFPNFGKRSLSVLQNMSQGELNLDSMVSTIVNDAYENISEHFVIVLDDYHLVDQSKPVSYFVSRFIQDTDDNCHVIIASRTLISLPDLPLMVARSQVGGLSYEELAFSSTEIQDLLLQNHHLTISNDVASDLANQTEGWVTGLLLSTQATGQGMSDRLRLGKASGVGLYDYLAQQVFDQQPPAVQEFLLRTSLIGEFDAAICKEVIGQALSIEENWEELIETLFRSNLFVLPVGEDNIWLRYHHLFADFLQRRILSERPHEAKAILTCLANVFSQRGEWERTFELLNRLGDTKAVEKLIEKSGTDLIANGKLGVLNEWLESLPREWIQANPVLLSLQGSIYMMQKDPQRGLEVLNRAVEMLRNSGDLRTLSETLIRRSINFRMLGDYSNALADAEEVLEIPLEKLSSKTLCAEALHVKGNVLYQLGHVKEALACLTESLAAYQNENDEQSAAMIWMDIGNIHLATANYLAAEHSYTKALEYWQETKNSTWMANVLNNLGELQRLMGDFENAILTLEKAIDYAKDSGYLRLEAYSLASIGDLYLDLDAVDQALEAYNKARLMANRVQDKFLLLYLDLGEAVLTHRQGNTFQAQTLLRNARRLAEINSSQYEQNLCRLESGRIGVNTKSFAENVSELEKAFLYFAREGHTVNAMRAQLYLAIAQYQSDRVIEAKENLQKFINQLTGIDYRAVMFTSIREVRPFLEQMNADGFAVLIQSLFQEVANFEKSLSAFRRRLRRKAMIVPFAPPKIYIQALGKMYVKVNDQVVTSSDWQTQTARDLFFFLLAHQEGVTKEVVGEIFWMDSSPAELKMRFKNTIYRLRRAVGKDAVIFQDEYYFFNTALDYEYDVESFFKEIYHAERTDDRRQKINFYQAALKYYQGPYLQEGTDTWILEERQNIYRNYIGALQKLAALYLESEKYEDALLCCQRMLNEDPCIEEAHRLAMKAYAAMGNRSAIVKQYEYCQQALSEELNAKPSPVTNSLFELLMR